MLMTFPTKEDCLELLSHMRELKFGMWELWTSNEVGDLRDMTEKEIRILDYLMEAIKRNDII